ncbi:hypothetical protein AVEN_265993-1 [Araneus ventricosus]|uniref:Uncharacterized protein n=1 Tax=Araneus ventricosus TaxID=182803 RepID=A0A4Y2E3B1_ARAVE|nr:hypothetical protein AVEN_265993-1 [Araneus ventricosus]
MNSLHIRHPFTALVGGATSCGKTHLIKKLIDFKMIHPFPPKIIWCYGAYKNLYKEMKTVEFHEGLPSNINTISNDLIVIDDLMSELSNNDKLTKLFTKGSHHRNLSIIFIVQNIFHKGKEMRDISLNAHCMFVFKNPRDRSQVMHLGRQLYPNNVNFFREVYEDATSKAYSYLLIDLTPQTEDSLRLRTGLFPGDKYYVYQPR